MATKKFCLITPRSAPLCSQLWLETIPTTIIFCFYCIPLPVNARQKIPGLYKTFSTFLKWPFVGGVQLTSQNLPKFKKCYYKWNYLFYKYTRWSGKNLWFFKKKILIFFWKSMSADKFCILHQKWSKKFSMTLNTFLCKKKFFFSIFINISQISDLFTTFFKKKISIFKKSIFGIFEKKKLILKHSA